MTARRTAALAAAAACLLGVSTAPADASRVKYKLTATYDRVHADWRSGEYCGPGSPPGGGDPIYVCSADAGLNHETTTYTALSTRSFTFTRGATKTPFFSFSAPMKGSFRTAVNRNAWSNWFLGGIGHNLCTSFSGGTGGARLTGTVAMSGYGKARVRTNLRTRSSTKYGSVSTTSACQRFGAQETMEPVSAMTDRNSLRFVDLRKVYGKEFTVTDTRVDRGLLNPPRQRTRTRWTFRFTPVAKKRPPRRTWHIDVAGHDTWSWGMFTGLRAGVGVDWLHRTVLVVRGGKIVSARGKVYVPNVRAFSEPDGAFSVSHRVTTPKSYKIRRAIKRKRSNRVELGLLALNRSEYRVRFTTTAAGPPLLEQLRRIGVANPDASYANVVKRGPVEEAVASIVPLNPRVVVRLVDGRSYRRETDAFNVQLPCTRFGAKEDDCFRRRGGEIITVKLVK